jgi:hypothetical protein
MPERSCRARIRLPAVAIGATLLAAEQTWQTSDRSRWPAVNPR